MKARRGGLVLAVLLIAGCSRLSVGWRLAPWMLERELAGMLGVAAADRPQLKRDARAYLDTLARQEAPRLAAWGHQLARVLLAGHDDEAVKLLFDGVERHWNAVLEPGLAPAARWLARQPAQRAAALAKAFDERDQRDFKRWADPARAIADREKRLRAGLKDYLGDLTPAQDEGVHAWALRAAFPVEGWKADRLRRQAALLARLKQGDPQLEADLQAQLRRWWLMPQTDRLPIYQRDWDDYRARLRTACAQLLASLTPGQRQRLGQRLHALADDLDAIGRQAVEKAAP